MTADDSIDAAEAAEADEDGPFAREESPPPRGAEENDALDDENAALEEGRSDPTGTGKEESL